jgi:hypothetical protein
MSSSSEEVKMPQANYFSDSLGSFLQLNFVPKIKTSNEMTFVVDISGSMEGIFDNQGKQTGSPIGEINKVLSDIQNKNNGKANHKVITYNTRAEIMPLQTYLVRKPHPQNMTYFAVAFEAMKREILSSTKNISFVFMTDGEDTSSNPAALQKAMTELRLVCSAYATKNIQVTVHVVGFGSVKADFLNRVVTLGNFEGKFRYAAESKELVSTFSDIFDFCENTMNCELIIDGKSYQTNATTTNNFSNYSQKDFQVNPVNSDKSNTIELLLPLDVDLSKVKSVLLKYGSVKMECNLQPFDKVNPLLKLKAMELREPNNEQDVLSILKELNFIRPKGLKAHERIELEQIRREMNEKLLGYLKIFNGIKGQTLDEESKLKLKNLRSETNFSKARRQKTMEMRINVNITHMQKLDSELVSIKKSITDQEYKELKEHGDQWSCILSLNNVYDIMHDEDNIDDFLCLGVLVERDEIAIDSPATGLRLKSISSSVISYNSFIDAMNSAIVSRGANFAHGGFTAKTKAERRNANDDRNYEEEDKQLNIDPNKEDKVDIDDVYCVVGQHREHINAVVPLFIHPAHYRKVKALKKCWLGYLYTLDSRGYDKHQESGLLSILGSFICKYDGTYAAKRYLNEFEKVCGHMIKDNKELFTEEKYRTFIGSVAGRARQHYPNLITPLVIAHLRGLSSLEESTLPVFWEYIKRSVRDSYSNNKIEAHKIAYKLLYGDPTLKKKEKEGEDKTPHHVKVSKMEEQFFEYFYNPHKTSPPKMILDDGNSDKTNILHVIPTNEIESSITELMPTVPKFMELFLTNLATLNEKRNALSLLEKPDEELTRRHLLLSYYYFNDYPDENVNEENIIEKVHTKFQTDQDNDDKNSKRDDENQMIANAIINCEDLSAFGGMLRHYCSTRCSPIFFRVVDGLIRKQCRDKLIALLTNEINDTKIYTSLNHLWLPIGGDELRKIVDIVGTRKMTEIENKHKQDGATCGHIYRESNLPNSHGHCNTTPYVGHNRMFRGYNNDCC